MQTPKLVYKPHKNNRIRFYPYLKIGHKEGAKCLVGGNARSAFGADKGFYMEFTVFSGKNKIRVFQEEIFDQVLAATAD